MSQFDVLQFKDFLREYNRLTERCFGLCVNNLNNNSLAEDENVCIKKCVTKYLNINQKLMRSYQELQPEIIKKRNAEVEQQMINLAKAKELSEQTESQQVTKENE